MIYPDDTTVVRIARSEMGQGTLTGLAQLVADEWDADWSKVRADYISPEANFANKQAWGDPWKRKKMETVALMLRAALAAEEKVGLKMNVPRAKLATLLKELPALRNPTISTLSREDWVAVETIIDEKIVREIIPQLKDAGAEGIIEYPLNKVIY